MSVKVEEIMRKQVIFSTPEQRVGHLKTLFKKNKINILPVIDHDEEIVGVVSSRDLLDETNDEKHVRDMMTEKVYTIPPYEKVNIAAKIMRNHHIHHLIVTHEKKLVGIISTFDLLKILEKSKFTAKNMTAPTKAKGKRAKTEVAELQ
jgi:CBS domain-containing protein